MTYWNTGAERLHGIAAPSALGRHLSNVVRYHVQTEEGRAAPLPASDTAKQPRGSARRASAPPS